jgi:dTDP-glucose 4,6-dehydratase
MNLLVVGGAGFIGINYVKLITNGALGGVTKLTVLDSFTYASNRIELLSASKQFGFKVLELDIRDRESIIHLKQRFDVVLNFAAESHVDRSIEDPTNFISTNIIGLQNLLDFARNTGAKFVQVSTDEVYGSIEKGSWDENCLLMPNSPYAASKASGDLLVRSYIKTYDMDGIITRSCNNYGPFQHAEKFIPKIITNLLSGIPVPIYGSGMNSREWIYVEDNVKGIHNALLNGKPGSVFNLGSGTEMTNLELFKLICDIGGFDPALMTHVSDRLGHDFRYSLNFSKAIAELEFLVEFELREGLRLTLNWYREKFGFSLT